MELITANYSGITILEVIGSLENDKDLMDFISGQNLSGGDVLEAIASAMVCDDPAIVYIDANGKVTTSDDEWIF